MDNKEWFRNARFGMMVHWGLYSLLAGEYDSRRTDVNAEWIMATHKIPIKVYEKLTRAFNPVFFDPEEWVLLAKNAGMKYLVITAKHHDGFAMYGSEADDYNVVDRTPFGRDVIAEVADACRKHDMRLGLYYSQEIDWHEKDGGLFCRNSWDFPDESGWDFSRCFEKKIKPQVKELVTKFDDLLLIWFDTPKCITPGQSDELYRLVKSARLPDQLAHRKRPRRLHILQRQQTAGGHEDRSLGMPLYDEFLLGLQILRRFLQIRGTDTRNKGTPEQPRSQLSPERRSG